MNIATAKKQQFRLRAVAAPATLRVERPVEGEHFGKIHGLALATEGEASGHGFHLDAMTTGQIARFGEGIKGRWTHPDACSDGLGKHLGRWHDLTVIGKSAAGTFEFSRAAHQFQPDGLNVSAATYLMDRAEEVLNGTEPKDVLGISIVSFFGLEESEDSDGNTLTLARIENKDDLEAADFVDSPAASDGLFAGLSSQVVSKGADHLEFLAKEIGEERLIKFLARWIDRKQSSLAHQPERSEDEEKEEDLCKLCGESLTEDLAEGEQKLCTECLAKDNPHKREEEEDMKLQKRVEELEAQLRDSYLESLKAQSTTAQSPIPEAQLSAVRDLLDAGHESAAKTLGAALLETAQSKLARNPVNGNLVTLTATESDHEDRVHRAQASMLRTLNYTVIMNEDDTRIVSATPPAKSAKGRK